MILVQMDLMVQKEIREINETTVILSRVTKATLEAKVTREIKVTKGIEVTKEIKVILVSTVSMVVVDLTDRKATKVNLETTYPLMTFTQRVNSTPFLTT